MHGLSEGTATIRATYTNSDGSTASAAHSMTVSGGTLTAIRISPTDATVAAGRTQQFTALCDYTDTTGVDCTETVTWESDDTDTADVNQSGLATTYESGTVEISASMDGETDAVRLTVGDPVLDRIVIGVVSAAVEVNRTRYFNATCYRSDGTSYGCGGAAAWASSDTAVLSFPNKDYYAVGEAFAAEVGAVNVTAQIGAVTSAPLAVSVVIPSGCDGALTFADPDLEALIRARISIPTANLMYDDVKDLDYIEIYGVDDLSGIGCLTGLTELTISRAGVSDISELTELTKLTDLDVSRNFIVEIPNLSSLRELRSFNLQDNTSLYWLGGLSGLPNLEHVALGPAPSLDDLYALGTCPKLNNLYLSNIGTNDLSPLVDNPGIGSGDVLDVWIYDPPGCNASAVAQLTTLQARGVAVTANCL